MRLLVGRRIALTGWIGASDMGPENRKQPDHKDMIAAVDKDLESAERKINEARRRIAEANRKFIAYGRRPGVRHV